MTPPSSSSAQQGRAVQVGAIVPNTGALPLTLGLGRMAATAEQAGAASIWVSDHLLMLDTENHDYPYSSDGRLTWDIDAEYYEAFICLALMAAATTSCRVGTAVLILPQRNVLEVAKMASSLDQLAHGRLVLGLGAGWNAAEMEALGYPFQGRGRRFNEMLRVLRDCWSGRPRGYDGEHVHVPEGIVLSPTPAQAQGPPLLVGGMTRAAVKRAAEYGDGWLALAFVSTWDPEALRERLTLLRTLRTELGRQDPPYAILKLHASPAEAGALPALVEEAALIGFNEIAIEPPWDHGLEAVRATISAARSAADSLTTLTEQLEDRQ